MYPTLSYLFGTYFHQDWDIEGENAAAVVGAFADEEPGRVAEAQRELKTLLALPLTEYETRRLVWSGLACYYYPMFYGVEMREWLYELDSELSRLE